MQKHVEITSRVQDLLGLLLPEVLAREQLLFID
jgi:hypothetical protein